MKFKNSTEIITVIAIVAFCFLMLALNKCEKEKVYNNLLDSSIDSTMIWKNKQNQWEAESKILYGEIDMLKSKVLSRDSTIAKLQKIVNKKTISATIINTTTESGGTTPTTAYLKDIADSCVYETAWESDWEKGFIRATKDSIFRDIKIRNEFHIEQHFKSQGVFKQDVPVVTITNLNPNTQTNEIKTFTVAQKKPYRGVWFVVGGVVVFIINMFL